MRIRPERPEEFDAIGTLVTDAFGDEPIAALVEAIRASEWYEPDLSLVAADESDDDAQHIVGHVMISWAMLRNEIGERPVMMLSPLAVSPDRQGSGIGGALVRAVTTLADMRTEPLVIVEGSPSYYSRFGFADARRHGLRIPLPDWAPPEAGQVILLSSYDPDDPTLRGDIVYPPAFDDVD